jgi:hypothetical protein
MTLFEEILTAYHGDSGDTVDYFTKHQSKSGLNGKNSIGKWYSSSPEVALTYGRKQYKAELKFNDPMIVDARGDDWDHFNVPADEDERGAHTIEYADGTRAVVRDTSTDKLSIRAKKDGHDGLIIRNVVDFGSPYGPESSRKPADDIVALEPDTIKNEQLFESVYASV